jgi:hypothetical protein
MLGKTIIGFILCISACRTWANPDRETIHNLKLRMHQLSGSRGSLIKSFTNHSQSYVYDQALAIIAFSREQEQAAARALLKGLAALQLPDGSLYFSYYLDGSSPYPVEGDKRFAGAIAWTALAASYYQQQFKTDEFKAFNLAVLGYLRGQMLPLKNAVLALKFAATDLPATPWREDETAALEHNLDAYAAFGHYLRLNPEASFQSEINGLQNFIKLMWDNSRSHFWSGMNLKTGEINRQEIYLDNQSWAMLAVDEKLLLGLSGKEALAFNCENFLVQTEGLTGFMDRKSARGLSVHSFIWSEGTAGQLLAMKRLGMDNHSCGGKDVVTIMKSMWQMKTADGGIAYATASQDADFTTASSVAGTTWFYFARNNFNPFQLKEI